MQRIFVTGWFKRHGIGFLDPVLQSLQTVDASSNFSEPGTIIVQSADQYNLAKKLGYSPLLQKAPPQKAPQLSFDQIIYLIPQNLEKVLSVRPLELIEGAKWEAVLDSVRKMSQPWNNWENDFEQLRQEIRRGEAFPSFDWLQNEWTHNEDLNRLRVLWHVINEAPLKTQLEWYKACSPLYKAHEKKFKFHKLNIDDNNITTSTAKALQGWVQTEVNANDQLIVNLWGTETSLQFSWYYLAWRRPKLKKASFIECRTQKDKDIRYAPIRITTVQKDPIAELNRDEKTKAWESKDRKERKAWLKFLLKLNDLFTILLLGERGTGKTQSVKEIWEEIKGKKKSKSENSTFISANCANFSDHEHARSELFGHVKGAFSGATEDRKGLFEQADNGLLFLDEIHHLEDSTRAMLLTALQTDKDGNFSFTPLGGSVEKKVKFQLVVAANIDFAVLRKELQPDFLDRISQRIVTLPPISSEERKGAWNSVWNKMDFKGNGVNNPAEEKWFIEWLKNLQLDGNFRDLEYIAILVADYQRGSATQQGRKLGLDNLENWLKKNWEKSRGTSDTSSSKKIKENEAEPAITKFVEIPLDLENPQLHEKNYLKVCKKEFAEKLRKHFGNQKKAVAELRKRGSKMTKSTFSNWINEK